MAWLTCCLWWFLLGLLLGWILNWLLSRIFRRVSPVEPGELQRPAGDPSLDARGSRQDSRPSMADSTLLSSERYGTVSPSRLIDVGAARAAGFNLKHSDDLTIIEGIGPKIDDLFRNNGVSGFAQLAQMSVDEMLEILDKGGSNFKLANPQSWAQQALLAAENHWAELKTLQDELVGGVDRSPDR